MKNITFKSVLSVLAVTVALSACTMIPKYEQPAVNVPETFKYDTQAGTGIQATSLGWQDYFADPRLYRLIDIALERNTDLCAAALNVERPRKQYMISRADLLPGINATGSGSRGRTAKDLGSTDNSYISSTYNVGLGVTSYELGLFGEVRSNIQAVLQTYFSSLAARDSAHLNLIASMTKAYFSELYAQDSMKLAQNVLKSRERTLKLTQLKHKAGAISAVDLSQQQALIESAKADYENAVKNREQARNVLAVLINGLIPEDPPAPLPLDKQFKITKLPAGLSSGVLLNRPDIRATEFDLEKANANIGAARTAFFPSISLTSTIDTGSTELSGLFKGGNCIWVFAPTINLPIFNWGSNKANLDYAKIQQQIWIVNYEAAVQSAFRDVSDVLVVREQLDKTYAANRRQSKAYTDALRLVRLRYKHDVSSALDLLDAERSSHGADTALLSSQLTRLENLADLYKALSGGLKRMTGKTEGSSK